MIHTLYHSDVNRLSVQPIIVTCRRRAKKQFSHEDEDFDHVMVIDCHTHVCGKPPIYTVIVEKKSKEYDVLKEAGAFVIHFPDSEMNGTIDTLRSLSDHAKKFDHVGFTAREAQTIEVARIHEIPRFLECVTQKIECIGDHAFFVAKINHPLTECNCSIIKNNKY